MTVTEWILTSSIPNFTQKHQRKIKYNRQRLWSRFILEKLIFVLFLNEVPDMYSASCWECSYCYRHSKSVWTNPRLDTLNFSYITLNRERLSPLNNTRTFISWLKGTQPVSITETNNLMLYKITHFLILDSRSGWVVKFTFLPIHIQANRLAYLLNRRLDRTHKFFGGPEEEINPYPNLKSSHHYWNIQAVEYNNFICPFAILAKITLISKVKFWIWK